MTRLGRFLSLKAALLSGIGLAGCAPLTDSSAISTSPVTMVCDGGKTFTVSYTNGFETAIIETDGQRLELPRARRSFSLNAPNPPDFETRTLKPPLNTAAGGITLEELGHGEEFGRVATGADVSGISGVRYDSDEGMFISRNRAAVLQVGDEIYSNCQVART
jgi:hypothetical protein